MDETKKTKKKKKIKDNAKTALPYLFQPGQSGNPNGRPKRGHALSDQLRKMMAAKEIKIEVTIKTLDKDGKKPKMKVQKWEMKASHDFNTIICMALIEKAVQGDVYAFNTIADRLEGKPIQTNLIADSNEYKNLPLEEKQKKLSELLAKTFV